MSEKFHPKIEESIITDQSSPDFGRFNKDFAEKVAREVDEYSYLYDTDPTDPKTTESSAKDILADELTESSTETAYSADDRPPLKDVHDKHPLSLEIKLGHPYTESRKYPKTFNEGLDIMEQYDAIDRRQYESKDSKSAESTPDSTKTMFARNVLKRIINRR